VRRMGLLTLGQAPRADGLAREVGAVLGPGVELLERGALDLLSRAEVAALAPGPRGTALVTLLRGGEEVTLDRALLLPHLQRGLQDLEAGGAEAVLLVCSGEFPELASERPLLVPHQLLYRMACSLLPARSTLGVLMPLERQLPDMEREFAALGVRARGASASPYGAAADLRAAAAQLHDAGAALVYLDCFGYDRGQKELVQAVAGCPVLLARSAAARAIANVLE